MRYNPTNNLLKQPYSGTRVVPAPESSFQIPASCKSVAGNFHTFPLQVAHPRPFARDAERYGDITVDL